MWVGVIPSTNTGGDDWLESSIENNLGVLVLTSLVLEKTNITQQCMFATQKANHILDCIEREVILFLYSTLVGPHLQYCVHFWLST